MSGHVTELAQLEDATRLRAEALAQLEDHLIAFLLTPAAVSDLLIDHMRRCWLQGLQQPAAAAAAEAVEGAAVAAAPAGAVHTANEEEACVAAAGGDAASGSDSTAVSSGVGGGPQLDGLAVAAFAVLSLSQSARLPEVVAWVDSDTEPDLRREVEARDGGGPSRSRRHSSSGGTSSASTVPLDRTWRAGSDDGQEQEHGRGRERGRGQGYRGSCSSSPRSGGLVAVDSDDGGSERRGDGGGGGRRRRQARSGSRRTQLVHKLRLEGSGDTLYSTYLTLAQLFRLRRLSPAAAADAEAAAAAVAVDRASRRRDPRRLLEADPDELELFDSGDLAEQDRSAAGWRYWRPHGHLDAVEIDFSSAAHLAAALLMMADDVPMYHSDPYGWTLQPFVREQVGWWWVARGGMGEGGAIEERAVIT